MRVKRIHQAANLWSFLAKGNLGATITKINRAIIQIHVLPLKNKHSTHNPERLNTSIPTRVA